MASPEQGSWHPAENDIASTAPRNTALTPPSVGFLTLTPGNNCHINYHAARSQAIGKTGQHSSASIWATPARRASSRSMPDTPEARAQWR
jgi:hypothetical protein